ncbi:MAG TPA: IS110 family transposase [Chloroflexia bacterium]|nr:IS110 family transposase [Chloroflexia bacterium]
MDLLFPACAGLDVHKDLIVACAVLTPPSGAATYHEAQFGTTTAELLRLSDWLGGLGVPQVGMESTGVYWKPIYYILEGSLSVWVLNAQHVKNVPGRKTAVQDARWVSEWLRHGLVQPRFVPPPPQRELRLLTRERTNFVRQRATLINRVQKLLEDANIKLGSVVSDMSGVSARAMLAGLLAGQATPAELAELARGRLREKRGALAAALAGRMQPVHRLVLTELLAQMDNLEETIGRLTSEIERRTASQADIVAQLDAIPGVGRGVVEGILAEIGTDMGVWGSDRRLAAWCGVAPGNNESAGKRRSGKTRPGNKWVRTLLIQAARGAVRTKGSYFAAQYRRLVPRLGDKRAIVAVAHAIIVAIYHMLERGTKYVELGGDYFVQRAPAATAKRLARQLEKLGYTVTLAEPSPA